MSRSFRSIVHIVASALAITGKTVGLIPIYMYRRRKGAAAFSRQLEQLGIRGAHAKELTETYLQLGDVPKLVRTVRRHRS